MQEMITNNSKTYPTKRAPCENEKTSILLGI